MNSKNRLQEIYQKKKEPMPKYKTYLQGGKPHCPHFISEITVNNIKFVSEIYSNKKDAETDVAEKVLNYLDKIKSIDYERPKLIDKVVIIDLENIPVISKTFSPNTYVIGFMSKSSSPYSKIEDYKNKMEIKIIDSSIKDATDTYIIFYTARLITELSKNMNIYIVTKDHFGSVLTYLIEEKSSHKAFHIKDIKEL